MKMEELIGRLEESENTDQRALSKSMKREFLKLEKEKDIDIRNNGFQFLKGCIKTMLAFGGITDAEENELWHEIFACL